MDKTSVKVEIRRDRRESGQVISAIALAPSRRILAVIDVIVPLMPGYTIAERVGKSVEKAIIEKAQELARSVAEAVETEPART